jgi:hypothetical protein
MKKTVFLLLIASILYLSPTLFAQQKQPKRTVLYSLANEEFLVYGENCFLLSTTADKIYFVSRNGNEYFFYDNGVKKGPYAAVTPEMLNKCGDASLNSNCAIADETICPNTESPMEKYVSMQSGNNTIKFKGKSYGPFFTVMQMFVTCDQTKFTAVAMDANMKTVLLNSDGKNIVLDGTPSGLLYNYKTGYALLKLAPAIDYSNFDPSKFDLNAMSKVTLMDGNGVKFGTFDGQQVSEQSIWFSKTSGNHWFMQVEGKVFMDGKELCEWPENASRCDLWFSPDGKKFVISNWEGISFPDGYKGPAPLDVSSFEENGVTVIKWIALDTNKDLAVYSREL